MRNKYSTMEEQNRLKQSDMLQNITKQIEQISYDFSKFTIPDFAQWVANKRGMDIHIEPYDDIVAPVGFWFTSNDGAHVKYSSSLSPTLQIITILHELMHIYFGHKTKHIPFDLPLLECYRGIAARDPSRQDSEDQEAETGALLVYQRYLSENNGKDTIIALFGGLD